MIDVITGHGHGAHGPRRESQALYLVLATECVLQQHETNTSF